jgi:hypothetical protein
MEFELDFNREVDDITIELLGAKLIPTGVTKYPPFEKWVINLETFEELEKLLEKVEKIKGKYYSAVISFDPATIYLDNQL